MPDAGDIRWMTYAEIRDAFALPSTKAAVQRSRRAGWPRRQNNADKFARVGVPVEALAAPRNPSHEASRNPPTVAAGQGVRATGSLPGGVTDPHGVNAVLAELRAAHDRLAGELRQRAERAESEVVQLRAEVLAERERANTMLARTAEVVRLQGELLGERERANAAVERALEAEARLAAGTPGARALKVLRDFLGQWKRP
jgi:hypothetical protein